MLIRMSAPLGTHVEMEHAPMWLEDLSVLVMKVSNQDQ